MKITSNNAGNEAALIKSALVTLDECCGCVFILSNEEYRACDALAQAMSDHNKTLGDGMARPRFFEWHGCSYPLTYTKGGDPYITGNNGEPLISSWQFLI